MAKKEPNTMKGIGRKILTGDGRKKPLAEKLIERQNKSVAKKIKKK